MFPLGSVLFPHMPLALRLFEPRYLVMLGQLLEQPNPEFGVVLIERGHEVGGGDHRFVVGTMARIVEVEALEGFMALVANGNSRFRVTQWLPDDPYPRADIEALSGLDWDDSLSNLRAETETEVRRALAIQSEYGAAWPSDVELSDDPLAACWQLAGLTPVGSLDQLTMLQAETAEELLTRARDLAHDAIETVQLGWGEAPE